MKTMTEFKPGETLKVTLAPVSRLDLIKYAGASGDFNPIHTIDEEAKKAGLPGIIAHGMWTMGNLGKLFTPFLEKGFIKEYKVRFAGMVFLDDVLTLKAELAETSGNDLFFNVKAVKEKGQEVVKGSVHFRLYDAV
ncbi:MaoC domain-containing protein dehydratase [Caldibacillus thermoamylovorans]|uniref:MaoC domain-containing protein dehydratase n=2 Tax=Bacillales TaxID=1385 RepID=A0A090IXH8_9BACI|nr:MULTISPECIES: MaoC/PaaZ C-terminal domain-containing protein [Bacillaceae]AWI13175.1 dehydratase [Caldibacillus thermoamylovorans]PAC34522.1 dehydratase [Caldifermentibacillus hisashii]CEE02372.1 MaoC domain-containing protein dehydratase [Caldibacillus thermoamylovorans]